MKARRAKQWQIGKGGFVEGPPYRMPCNPEFLRLPAPSRFLVHHAESDSLFEVFSRERLISCLGDGADDVTGVPHFEAEFRGRKL